MIRGIGKIISGILVMVLGIGVPLAIAIPNFLNIFNTDDFLVPGQAKIMIEEPGEYYLMNAFNTMFNGESYHSSEKLPHDLEITIYDTQDNELRLQHSQSYTMNSGSTSMRSIGLFEVMEKGAITVNVTGDFEPRIFAVAKSDFIKIFLIMFGAIGAVMATFLAGCSLIIWGVINIANQRSKPPLK